MSAVTGKTYKPEDFVVWDCFTVLSAEEKKAVFVEISKPGFCRDLEPVEGAIDAVARLRKIVDVYPVTSPWPSATWIPERIQWLQDRFGFKRDQIVHTASKYLVSGEALLDDKPEHIVAWTEEHPNGLGMLWHIPNTRLLPHDEHRVRSWDEVIAKVEAMVSG